MLYLLYILWAVFASIAHTIVLICVVILKFLWDFKPKFNFVTYVVNQRGFNNQFFSNPFIDYDFYTGENEETLYQYDSHYGRVSYHYKTAYHFLFGFYTKYYN